MLSVTNLCISVLFCVPPNSQLSTPVVRRPITIFQSIFFFVPSITFHALTIKQTLKTPDVTPKHPFIFYTTKLRNYFHVYKSFSIFFLNLLNFFFKSLWTTDNGQQTTEPVSSPKISIKLRPARGLVRQAFHRNYAGRRK
mgnify:CR=1 FL=1